MFTFKNKKGWRGTYFSDECSTRQSRALWLSSDKYVLTLLLFLNSKEWKSAHAWSMGSSCLWNGSTTVNTTGNIAEANLKPLFSLSLATRQPTAVYHHWAPRDCNTMQLWHGAATKEGPHSSCSHFQQKAFRMIQDALPAVTFTQYDCYWFHIWSIFFLGSTISVARKVFLKMCMGNTI